MTIRKFILDAVGRQARKTRLQRLIDARVKTANEMEMLRKEAYDRASKAYVQDEDNVLPV